MLFRPLFKVVNIDRLHVPVIADFRIGVATVAWIAATTGQNILQSGCQILVCPAFFGSKPLPSMDDFFTSADLSISTNLIYSKNLYDNALANRIA
jgi:hypothetical protein